MPFKNKELSKIKNQVFDYLFSKDKNQIIVVIGLVGLILISASNIFKKSPQKQNLPAQSQTMESRKEKLEQNLENIISSIEGAGKAKVLITFENSAETVYAAEERKNKEASEDKSEEKVTRKKETDDCEKKYITIKDSEGTEHALAVKEIEPKVKGVIAICPGGDNPVVKKRIIEAITTALNIISKHVCVTKSV